MFGSIIGGIGSAIGGLVGGIGSIFTGNKANEINDKAVDNESAQATLNYEEQKRQYEENMAFQKENYEYQKGLQERVFNREDTAIQRAAADLEAAGLSPTLAAGQGAGAGSVVSTSAPQGQAPQRNEDISLQNAKADRIGNILQSALGTANAVEQIMIGRENVLKTQEERKLLGLQQLNAEAGINERLYNMGVYQELGLPTNAGMDRGLRWSSSIVGSENFEAAREGVNNVIKSLRTPGSPSYYMDKSREANASLLDRNNSNITDNATNDQYGGFLKSLTDWIDRQNTSKETRKRHSQGKYVGSSRNDDMMQ